MPNILSQFLHSPDRGALFRKQVRRGGGAIGRFFRFGLPGRYTVTEWAGLRLLIDKSSLVDNRIYYYGDWESEQQSYLITMIKNLSIKEKAVFLDIGAYWGLYGIQAFRLGVPEVHFFEPDVSNRYQLCSQLLLNQLEDRAIVHPIAVSDHEGEVRFRRSNSIGNGNRGHAGIAEADESSGYVVRCRRLDDILDIRGKHIICKIDVEGAELRVLAGMRNLILANEVTMQVEVSEQNSAEFRVRAHELGLEFRNRIWDDEFFVRRAAS